MKKIIKISFVAIALSLFFLNVSLTSNDRKAEALSVNYSANIAEATAYCYWNNAKLDCFCWLSEGACIGECPNGYTGTWCGIIVE